VKLKLPRGKEAGVDKHYQMQTHEATLSNVTKKLRKLGMPNTKYGENHRWGEKDRGECRRE